MRVLYCLHGFEFGGTESIVFRWAMNLPTDRWRRGVMGLYRDGPMQDRMVRAGIPAQISWIGHQDPVEKERACGHVIATMDLCEVVHTFTGIPTVETALILAARSRVRVRVQSIGWLYVPPPDMVTHRIVESRWLEENCRATHPSIPVHYLPAPIDIPVLHQRSRDSDGLTVGRLGRLVHGKGMDEFLRVCKTIRASESNVRFVCWGDGPARVESEALARHYGLEVEFRGATATSCAALQEMDVFLYPTRSDSNALVNLEAMGSGLPVVTYDTGNISEYIEQGVNGFIESDPISMADRVLELLRTPTLRKDIGGTARRYVEEHHDSRKIGLQLADLYDQFLAESNT